MTEKLTLLQIIFRLVLVVLLVAMIGWDRQKKNRPAGVLVHILVALGAAIVGMVQQELQSQAINFALSHPNVQDLIASDAARLIAAVISGIGFLGAGTIIVTKRVVRGLSTAASLWASAVIGIAIGMGYYWIAVLGSAAILLSLIFIEKILRIDMGTDIEINFVGQSSNEEQIENFFKENKIRFIPKNFQVRDESGTKNYVASYAIKRPQKMSYNQLAAELIQIPEVKSVDLESY